jgi:hypothetical protein
MLLRRTTILVCLLHLLGLAIPTIADIVLETEILTIRIDDKGYVQGLLDHSSGTNYLASYQPAPLLSIRTTGQIRVPEAMHYEKSGRALTLRYPGGIAVHIRIEAKKTYVTFEVMSVAPEEGVELVIWGPYPTRIKEVIGETVGVVWNDSFALGIQTLNVKTLGGYPATENDVMPGRGETAKPMEFGSVLQAFTRDRRQNRVVSNWGHEKYYVPAYDDGGVTGSKIALFGCPPGRALKTIGEIEVAEGLPHPMLDGVWGKVSPAATASYLIIGFDEHTIDEAIRVTKRAGLRYLYHGGPFATWGHFKLNPRQFPDDWISMKRCVDRARTEGIRVGVHTLSNFITTNDPYVTPVPDKRLAKVGTSVLRKDIDATQTDIPIADPVWFNQMKNNSLRTVLVSDELIRYDSVSQEGPWCLLNCQRGAYGTQAGAHRKGDEISKLMDHPYKVFLTDAELSQEVAGRLADLFNQAGLMQISFDGLEGNWSTGMGQYGRILFVTTWYDHLSDDLRGKIICDASNPGHYFWHIYTRMNWGEPWGAGFREGQTQYRLNNQAYFRRNLMPAMLGWFNMTEQTSLEDAEWLLARAAGFDAGFALNTSLRVIRVNGLSGAILDAIKQWETARMSGAFTEAQKRRLQDINREFHLEALGECSWRLYPVYSAKYTLAQQVQPGQPVQATWEFDNPYVAQTLQFILQVAGDATLCDVTLEIDKSGEMLIPAALEAGNILRFSGGTQAIVHDRNWNELKKMELNASELQVGPGRHTLRLGCRFRSANTPALKMELRTVGEAETITVRD